MSSQPQPQPQPATAAATASHSRQTFAPYSPETQQVATRRCSEAEKNGAHTEQQLELARQAMLEQVGSMHPCACARAHVRMGMGASIWWGWGWAIFDYSMVQEKAESHNRAAINDLQETVQVQPTSGPTRSRRHGYSADTAPRELMVQTLTAKLSYTEQQLGK